MARARLVRCFTAVGVGTLLCLVAPTGAFAVGPGQPFDFDGDGHGDLAVGTPGESIGGQDFVGAVNVFRGTSTGPTVDGNQLWSQASAGIAGAAEFGDRFGAVVASGDFNRDGHADLAVGAPGETVGSTVEAGAVSVIYGSSSGLASAHDQQWSQSSKGVPGSSEAIDRFGSALAAGDFNGDGYADLAIGVQNEAIAGTESAAGTGTGLVNVLYGSKSGLTSKGAQAWTQNSKGIRGSTEFNDEFGTSLASADVDGDGYAELAVGIPYEDDQSGAVQLIRGSKKGLTPKGNQLWSQSSKGVVGTAVGGDWFGQALAFGDYNRDGRQDLAIGIPGEHVVECEECQSQGAVQVLLGAKGGLTGKGNRVWHVGDPGLPGDAAATNELGDKLVSGDFDGDGADDLAVTAPGADVGKLFGGGTVYVLDGSKNGLQAHGFVLTQDTAGVPSEAEEVGGFGMNLASRRFGGAYDSLVVGLPGVTVGGQDSAGGILVVPGSAQGLEPGSTRWWTQNSAGVEESAEDRDLFGEVSG